MDVEEAIRSALEREANREALPSDLFPAVFRRARVRRVLTSSVVTLTVVGTLIGGVAGLRAMVRTSTPQPGGGSTFMPTPSATPDSVAVPDVIGLSEGDAVKALAEAGLLAEIKYQREAPRTGQVLASDPPAGSDVDPGSSVRLRVAYERPLPVPDPTEEQFLNEQSAALGRLVERNAQAFVGLYRDHSAGTWGTLVVVFNPGAEQDAWRERLDVAAGDLPYRTETCTRSRRELEQVQDELAGRSWSPNAASISFGIFVDAASCTVRLESDQLTPSDIQALSDRFGTAVSLDTTEGARPRLLGPGG